jgi:hypothetical protein
MVPPRMRWCGQCGRVAGHVVTPWVLLCSNCTAVQSLPAEFTVVDVCMCPFVHNHRSKKRIEAKQIKIKSKYQRHKGIRTIL